MTPAVEGYAGERAAWDDFVRRTPGGTFFHLIGWKEVLERVFVFTPHYLIARCAGQVVGVLPLFELRGRGARHCLHSVPFAVEGGVCSVDDDARRALEAAALARGEACGVHSIELRDGLSGGGFQVREGGYARFRRALLPSDAANFAAVPRKQRRMIRVGQRAGLLCRVGNEALPAFYDLYARSVRDLGTPVFPYGYFRRLVEQFGEECVLLTVWCDGAPAAGVLSFLFNDTVLPYYAGSRRELRRYGVNDFMYWELMRVARARGCRVFDFGRSRAGSGAYDFKRHWGFEPEPLRYRVYVREAERRPERSLSDGSVRLLRRVWRRLPLAATKLFGPFFVRRYGPYYT